MKRMMFLFFIASTFGTSPARAAWHYGAALGLGISPTDIFGVTVRYDLTDSSTISGGVGLYGSRSQKVSNPLNISYQHRIAASYFLSGGASYFFGKGSREIAYGEKENTCTIIPFPPFESCFQQNKTISQNATSDIWYAHISAVRKLDNGIFAELGLSKNVLTKLHVENNDQEGDVMGIAINKDLFGTSVVGEGDGGLFFRLGYEY